MSTALITSPHPGRAHGIRTTGVRTTGVRPPGRRTVARSGSAAVRDQACGPAAGEARGAGSRPQAVRLTRRGRVVVTFVLTCLALLLLTVFSGYSAATDDTGTPVPTRTVVVDEGDTLWAIASRVAGPGETRELVHRIIELNSLAGPELVEGQRLAVPRG